MKVGFTKIHTKAKSRGGSEAIVSVERLLNKFHMILEAVIEQESFRRNGGRAHHDECWNCHHKFALINNLQAGDSCPYCQAKEILK